MRMQPKVSVIIPVYNTEAYLRECLDSVVNQTQRDIEIICVDDGSTDGSPAILKEYEKKDSRIKVLTQPNLNAGAARNHGLQYATGEYLSFLDSDDYVELTMLEDCCRTLEDSNADIVCFSAKQLDMRTGKIDEMPWSLCLENLPDSDVFSPLEIKTKIFDTFQNWPWNKVFRRAFIEKHGIRFQEIKRTNDMLFTCSALVLAERIAVIKHAYVYYRVGTGTSLQQTNYKHPLSFWDAYTGTKHFLVTSGLYEQYEQSLLNCVMAGMLYNYHSVKDVTSGAAIFSVIKFRGESDFQFLSHPKAYYFNGGWFDEYTTILKQDIFSSRALMEENARIQSREDELQNALDHVYASVSYRVGRAITWLPRKVRGGVRCYREHGFKYTIRRVVEKLIGKQIN